MSVKRSAENLTTKKQILSIEPKITHKDMVALLEFQAQKQTNKTVYTFLTDGENQEEHLAYDELAQNAKAVAATLQKHKAQGEQVLLLFPQGLAYIKAFWGCLYAGAVAVPAYPPRNNRNLERVLAIVCDSQAKFVLTTEKIRDIILGADHNNTKTIPSNTKLETNNPSPIAALQQARFITIEEINLDLALKWRKPKITPNTLAFLQYTSGSTSEPKGVMISHANILANEEMIKQGFGHLGKTSFVGWLPFFHDMGLIGNLLQTVYLGTHIVLMSPIHFLQKPIRWLNAISKYKATSSGGPNFAYDLCTQMIKEEDKKELDLGSWEVAFNGAEPIKAATMEKFYLAFKNCGFKKQAFYPTYGMAETTLFVTGAKAEEETLFWEVDKTKLLRNQVQKTTKSIDAKTLVSSGYSWLNQEVIIVNAKTKTQLGTEKIGEIWIKGPHIAQGYWQNQSQTKKTFQAYTKDQKGPYLRTGDLGFLATDGALFVTGRIKELLILRGLNYYPQDIEQAVEKASPLFRKNSSAAFTISDPAGDVLVVAVEVERTARVKLKEDRLKLIDLVRQQIALEFDLELAALVFLQPFSLSKTSSGKIQRLLTKEYYTQNKLKVLDKWEQGACANNAPLKSIDLALAKKLRKILKKNEVTVTEEQDLILDSLKAARVLEDIRTTFKATLSLAQFYEDLNFTKLLDIVASQQNKAPAPTLAATQDTGLAVLSSAQKRMWYLHQMQPDSSRYHVSTALRLKGDLDIAILKKSIFAIFNKHHILKTAFQETNGELSQIVHASLSLHLPVIDLSTKTFTKLQVKKLFKENADQTFDLATPPLMRTQLLKLSATDYILQLTFHHIVVDGWSMGIIAQDLVGFYQQFSQENKSGADFIFRPKSPARSAHNFMMLQSTAVTTPAPDDSHLVPQYLDYVEFQKRFWQNQALFTRQLNYWKQQLSGEIPILNLPTDYPRPKKADFKGKRYTFSLTPETGFQIKTFCKENKVSLFMFLLTIFNIQLYRYTQEPDICIGIPEANRPAEFQNTVGFFVNTLVMRTKLPEKHSFRDFLQATKKTVLQALDHKDLAFEKIVEALKPERIHNTNPFFQVMFTLQNMPIADLVLSKEIKAQKLDVDRGATICDLSLEAWEKYDGSLECYFEYSTALFKASSIKRFATHFETLIQSVLANTQEKVQNLEILTTKEKHKLIYEFNDTAAEYPKDKTISELFELGLTPWPPLHKCRGGISAAERKNQVAVVCGEEQLTYEELNAKANQLARVLRAKGVKPETIVGIMVERSLEMIVGIFAVLKAGGAYLPLDPEYPSARISYMLQDSKTKILLSQAKFLSSMSELGFKGEVLDLGEPGYYQGDTTNLAPLSKAHNLAYVIYTSGSTGQPKGVMLNHRGIYNHMLTKITELGILPAHTLCFNLKQTFVASIWQILTPLLLGSRLIIYDTKLAFNPLEFFDVVQKDKISVLEIVPAVLNTYLNLVAQDKKSLIPLTYLKKLVLTGEKVSAELVNRFYGLYQIPLVNAYGQSECSDDTLHYQIPYDTKTRQVPIGHPALNTQVYILDKLQQLLPLNCIGELYISGDGVSPGYLHNQNLTKEKFMVNPFSSGTKMYQTGDLAKWDADGKVLFCGRTDHQVKIRGNRVEISEIEATLKQIKGVNEVAVVAKTNKEQLYLCAYLAIDKNLNIKDIKQTLSKTLPDYMIPSLMVKIAKLPINNNGKIDRLALKNLADTLQIKGSYYAPPQSEIEKKLVRIWEEVLEVKPIGIKDSFFEVGGNSLNAIHVLSRIYKLLNIKIPLSKFFTFTNIQQTSNFIRQAQTSAYQAIPKLKKQAVYECSSAQKRLYFLTQFQDTTQVSYNITAKIEILGQLDMPKIQNTFQTLIARHETLRTSFRLQTQKLVQIVHAQADFKVSYLELKNQDVKRLSKVFTCPFDLTKPPLLRAQLIKIQPEKHWLLFDIHHIIADGTSLEILRQEFMHIYNGQKLPDLTLQYKDYAAWQNHLVLKKQEKYWLKEFEKEVPVLDLPTDYQRPNRQNFQGKKIYFKLNKATTKQIKLLCLQYNVTLYTFLLSTLNIILSKYTGLEDIVIGTAVQGRKHPDLENILGMFVNTLAIRSEPLSSKPFSQYLRELKTKTMLAFENQDYPFEKLLEKLKIKRDFSRNPLFEVMFVLQNMPTQEIQINDLAIKPYELINTNANFDLSFEAREAKGQITLQVEYATKLFKKQTIQSLITHFQQLIKNVVRLPEEKIQNLEILTAKEKHQLLYKFNDTAADYPKDKTISELFELGLTSPSRPHPLAPSPQVERGDSNLVERKKRVAVVCGEEQLTYEKLNARANQLARVLRKKGVKPETIVGIMVERSLEMIVGILAVLKAGGAYLPLDPEYPEARISYMLQDSQAKILLTQAKFLGSMSELGFKGEVLDLGNAELYEGDPTNLAPLAKAHNLAYVIYTSGSTGQPKGVMVEQRNVVNFLFSTYENYHHKIKEADNCLSLTNISFDVSVYEFFIPLIFGATLTLYKDNILDIDTLTKFIIDYKITMAYIPPSLLTDVYLQLKKHKNIQLNKLLVGVEPIKIKVLNKYLKLNSAMQIINGYGPTETTICATMFQYKFTTKFNNNVPIGKPLANTQIYILDKNNKFQFLGGVGEIYIAGANLARGYLNKPKLTQEKFIDNPFIPDTKMYRTGDSAKWLPDGNIEFLGRIDHQVKIRGFRIECGEIESVLNQHPQIKEAVVAVKKNKNQEKYLVVYYIASKNLAGKYLRNYLSVKLPYYMIPAFFIRIKKIPLTPNRKIDRKKLEDGSEIIQTSYIPPSTDLEKKLVRIWEEVLEVKPIGVEDDFFEVGGNSLKIINLVNAMHKKTTLKLSVNDVLQSLTIKKLLEIKEHADLNLENDAKLDFKLSKPKQLLKNTTPKNILLTGATGFLGIFLLKELLKTTTADIYCLIRAKNKQLAQKRILETAQKYQIPLAKYRHRIKAVTGDLAQPCLGLAKPIYTKLTQKIEAIYHNGALVNFVYPYQKLKPANVAGAKEVLKLATTKTTKPIHYVSTISVFDALHYKDKKILETHFLKNPDKLYGGYAQSKWVAEQLMLEAKKQGFPICLYRPGRIGGESKTGAVNTDDFLAKFIKGIIQLQKAPALDIDLEMSTVDSVSKSIVHISQQKKAFTKKAFHLINQKTITLKYLVNWIRNFGYPITLIPYKQWVKDLKNTLNINQENELKTLLPLFTDIVGQGLTIPEIYMQRNLVFDTKNTTYFLDKARISYHPINDQLLKNYFSYFIQSGFLAKPISKANKL
jgi:amino acid adenylation domain-containing protein/thioester reductase-like protein